MTFTNFLRCAAAVCMLLAGTQTVYAQYPQGNRPAGGGMGNIGRFYGRVLDEATGKGLGYASVQLTAIRFDSLSKQKKEVVIAGQLTEENGDFSLENLPVRGEFTLKVNFLGYASVEQKVAFSQPGSFDKDLGNIRLAASSQMLKEVTIQGEAVNFSLALDKKVFQVDQNSIAAGGNAQDALKNIPSVAVDIDGNVTMRSAAPQIFVDGRPTTLSLDQIPADAIDNVELITNPSAKYDASGGNAGIINIVLKKNRKVGYNGSVRTGVDMRGRVNLGGDLNARDRKVNAFIGGNFNQRRNLGRAETDRTNYFGTPLSVIDQVSTTENNGFFASGRGGVDWFMNNRNTLTFSGNYHGGSFRPEDEIDIRTDSVYETYTKSFESVRNSVNKREFRNLGTQLLFKHLFPKEGKEWTADLNYNLSKFNNRGDFTTTYLPSETVSIQRQDGNGYNQFITAQTDFVNPLTPSKKMEWGARAAIRDYRSDNTSFYFDPSEQVYIPVQNFADKYKFHDEVYAVYGTFSHSFKKWGYQAGLRLESSNYTGTLIDSDTSFTNSYPISAFPSLFLTYKVNEEDNLQLSVTRRINRPSFFQMIPFPDFSDSLLLSRGNPGLRPEFTQSAELSYQNIINKKHNLLTSIYFKRSTDLLTRYQFSEYNDVLQREAIVSSYINSNYSIAYGLEFTLKNTFWERLELTSNANFYNSKINAEAVEAGLVIEQFTWFLKENINLRLPKNFALQLSGEYQSRAAFAADSGGGGRGGGGGGWGGGPSSTAQGYSIPYWFMDISIRKDLWKRTASITLSMQDVFRSRRTGSYTESTLFVQDTWRRRDPQLVRLNFSYRFGKMDVSLFKRKNTRTSSEGMEGGF